MNDIWHFLLGLSDGSRDAMGDLNPLPILIVSILIGLFQAKAENYALKALGALAIVLAITVLTPVARGHDVALPDLRHIGAIAQMLLLYIIAFGTIGVLGSLKSMMKLGAAKGAH